MTTNIETSALVQSHEDATTYSILGGSISIRLRQEHTDGRLGLVEQVIPAGYPGPALHVHPDFDETFFVIDGSIAFRVGDEAQDAGPGTVAFIPRGTPHTFANRSDAPARMLVLVNPGGFERYFEALVEEVEKAGGGIPPVETLTELGIAHGSVPA